jgi:hypothetical protein
MGHSEYRMSREKASQCDIGGYSPADGVWREAVNFLKARENFET